MQARTLKLALASVCAAAIVAAGVTAYGQISGANMVAATVKPADRADDFRLGDQNSRAHLLIKVIAEGERGERGWQLSRAQQPIEAEADGERGRQHSSAYRLVEEPAERERAR